MTSCSFHSFFLVSECWMFYAVPTATVTFTAKTSLDLFNLRREPVLPFSVSGDCIYEMRCLFAGTISFKCEIQESAIILKTEAITT